MGSTSNSQQLYSLTWSEFGSSLISAVQLLRGHTDLFDVTLAAGGRTFQAHKIVLSAASPFLLNILKSTPCKHPVVLLAGVTAVDLEALLEFVYRGEVSVDPSQLPSLLQAAHCLSIQGLAPTPQAANSDKSVPSASTVATSSPASHDGIDTYLPQRKRRRTKRKASGTADSAKWPKGDGDTVAGGNNTEGHEKGEEGDNSQAIDDESKLSNNSDQPVTCPICNITLRQSRNLRRHLELLHFGAGQSKLKIKSSRKKRSRKESTTTVTSLPSPAHSVPSQSCTPQPSTPQPSTSQSSTPQPSISHSSTPQPSTSHSGPSHTVPAFPQHAPPISGYQNHPNSALSEFHGLSNLTPLVPMSVNHLSHGMMGHPQMSSQYRGLPPMVAPHDGLYRHHTEPYEHFSQTSRYRVP